MLWTIEGADANTGEETQVQLEAGSADEARSIARNRNLLVASVKAVGSLGYALPETRNPPGYKSLENAAMVLKILALLSYAGGIALTFLMGWSMLRSGRFQWEYYFWLELIGTMLLTLIPFVVGVFLHGSSEALLALRDIARNSFR